MSSRFVDVLIVGAGCVGLSTALTLLEAGLRPTVWAARTARGTTSAAAGAIWAPYELEPREPVTRWREHTYRVLSRMADRPGTGVRLMRGVEASRTPVAGGTRGEHPGGHTPCDPGELPPGYASGARVTVPLVDMPAYLAHLEGRLADAGVTVQARRIDALAEAAGHAPVVINCTGIGAHHLVPDPSVTPVRGQLVVVANPGLTEFFSEDSGASPEQCYIYPHGDAVVLGGVAQPGNWSLQPDPQVAAEILARCVAVEPRLRGARVLEHRVGLRPARPQVRLEEDAPIGATRVIHNYGHGRAGLTLSWGCASAVRSLL